MTEKDFRLLVTNLEVKQADKAIINEYLEKLKKSLAVDNDIYKIIAIEPSDAIKYGVFYHDDKRLTYILTAKINNMPFAIGNKIILNDLWNKIVVAFEISKLSMIKIDEDFNEISFNSNGYDITIKVRYESEFKDELLLATEALKNKFVSLAATDFKLLKNTVQIIKKVRDDQNITIISDYMIILILYYALSENFQTHTYEAYLREFNHGIDDFLKGIKIDQDDQTYQRLGVKRVNQVKKLYTVVDVACPNVNIAAGCNEINTGEFRKLKKAIQKMIENKNN